MRPTNSTRQHNMTARAGRLRWARMAERAMQRRSHAPRRSWQPGRSPRPPLRARARLWVPVGARSMPPAAQAPAVSTQRWSIAVPTDQRGGGWWGGRGTGFFFRRTADRKVGADLLPPPAPRGESAGPPSGGRLVATSEPRFRSRPCALRADIRRAGASAFRCACRSTCELGFGRDQRVFLPWSHHLGCGLHEIIVCTLVHCSSVTTGRKHSRC